MLKEWQFNILFFVGVGGALLLLIGPEIGLKVGQNPTAITGIGAILTYVLTQKNPFRATDKKKQPETPSEPKEGEQ
jgi:hypothetical protein